MNVGYDGIKHFGVLTVVAPFSFIVIFFFATHTHLIHPHFTLLLLLYSYCTPPSPSYRTELNGIAERLMLRPSDAKKVYQKAVTEKLTPMSVKLVKAFEEAYYSKEQLEKMRGTDSGEDLNADGSGGSLGLSSSSGSDLLTEVANRQTMKKMNCIRYFFHVHTLRKLPRDHFFEIFMILCIDN